MLSGHTLKKTKEIKNLVDIKLGIHKLELVNEYKYLGVIIDERLLFHRHIDAIKQKMAQRMYLLKKIRWSINHKDALLLYKSSILPFIDLGSIFYVSCDQNTQKILQVYQNKCLRIIIGKKLWNSTLAAHEQCKLLLVNKRQKVFLLKFAHKLSYKPENLVRHQPRSLRSNRKIMIRKTRANTSKYEKCYRY